MTDLTTMHLKCLLEKATPGPWEYVTGDTPDGRYIGNTDSMAMCIGVEANGEGSSCGDADLNLAAVAPELAKEVLWMRREIADLRNALVRTAIDCATMDNSEGKLAARVAQSAEEQLFRILLEGDHDE